MTFRVDGVSASYSQRRRSFNCGAVLGVCNYRDVGGVPIISTKGGSSRVDYFADLRVLNCTRLMHLLHGSAYLRWQLDYGRCEFSRAYYRRI